MLGVIVTVAIDLKIEVSCSLLDNAEKELEGHSLGQCHNSFNGFDVTLALEMLL